MTKEIIEKLVSDLLTNHKKEVRTPELWRPPIVKLVNANHPQILRLKEIVHPAHHLPTDFMNSPTVIITYFLPFSLKAINSNKGGYYASELWIQAYGQSANATRAIDDGLVEAVEQAGYRAAKPTGTSYVTPTTYKSCWSHRHIAYLGGMGTFGMNNLLITDSGCCGYYSSLITDLPIVGDQMIQEERCLYKRNGTCGLCLKQCVGDALKADSFDRKKCYDMVMRTEKYYADNHIEFMGESDACGKCAVGLPCSARNPISK